MEELIYVLGPVTSLLVWRAASHGLVDVPSREGREPSLARSRAHIRAIRSHSVIRALGDVPLDVIVGESRYAHRSKTLDINVMGGQLPSGSFCSMGNGLYVCSPELCFAMFGRGGVQTHLAEIGCELCGTYALPPTQTGSFCNCPSITRCDDISQYVKRLGGRHGCRNALVVLPLLQDGSDSPRETEVFLALTAPFPYGYGMPKPKLNAKVKISATARQELGRGTIIVDELWCDEEGKYLLVGEYDSKSHHFFATDSQGQETIDVIKVLSDDLRRELVRETGTPIVTIRREDTKQFQSFDAKATRMATILGVETVPSEGEVRSCRMSLFEELFDVGKWSREYQTLRRMAGYERFIRHPKKQQGSV